MGLALLALAAAIIVSILICQLLIVIAEGGGRNRPPGYGAAAICQPAAVGPASSPRMRAC
jgi:hypothetical protein